MAIVPLRFLLFFKNDSVHFTTFVTCLALFQATVLNLAFYLQLFQYVVFDSYRDILFVLSMPIVIFCTIFALFNLLVFPSLVKIIAIIFLLVGAPISYFIVTFKAVINHDMLINLLATNSNEVISLTTPMLVVYVVLLGMLPATAVCLIKIKPVEKILFYLIRRVLAALAALIIIMLVAITLYKNYAAFFRNHSIMKRYLLPSNYLGALYSHYVYLKNSDLPFVTIGQDAYIENSKKHQPRKNLVLLIVGETARAQNFTLNGYHKQTTPRLMKESNLINFKHTSSCGTSTAHSVPCMFSNMNRIDFELTNATHQSNVLDILKHSGVRLLWQENDNGCKGVCDRIETVNVTEKFKTDANLCQNGTCFDEVLLLGLDNYLSQLNADNVLIALHMIGSHGPTYYQRYPPNFAVFNPSCNTNKINQCSQSSLINTYDNTIIYTDYFIAKSIDWLKKYSQKYNVIMLYMSDHGESLGENGVYLHSMPYTFAPKEQTHIPFIVWASTSFFEQNNINFKCMTSRAKKEQYSHDHLFHTLLGIFNVKTEEYHPESDIFTACK